MARGTESIGWDGQGRVEHAHTAVAVGVWRAPFRRWKKEAHVRPA